MTTKSSLSHLSDEQLIAEVVTRAACEREATAGLIASLAELDARRLYLAEGCSSLFTYCTQVLHLSEHAAYGRIEAARAARRFPSILLLLADGSLTLTAVCLLAPHLTQENERTVLQAARHQSKREVERLVAALTPQPPVPSLVRKLPSPRPPNAPAPAVDAQSSTRVACGLDAEAPVDESAHLGDLPDGSTLQPNPGPSKPVVSPRPAVMAPLSPELYRLQCTLPRETYGKLRRAQDLLRHSIPNGEPAVILDRALTLLVVDLERKKFALASRPRVPRQSNSASRHVSAAVRREVWTRDEGRCAFEGSAGRCNERGFLEFHHVVPFAMDGETTVDNLQLRCRAHNAFEAARDFAPLPGDEDTGPQ